MNPLEPSTTESVVTVLAFVVLAAIVVAVVDAIRRSDPVGALLLVVLGPLGLLIYVIRRGSRSIPAG